MYRTGHYGAALLAYAPMGFLLLAGGYETLAAVGVVVALGGSMIPDWDHRVPFLTHRGITHTVWFALLVGGLFGGAGWYLGGGLGPRSQLGLAAYGFALGVITIGAHILADGLTPMGVQPFDPLVRSSYSLDVTRAANPIGNGVLLVLGVLAAGGAVVASQDVTIAAF
ncbi:MAG: metal-dependent hydrolase [Halodesulfurarchaeum sp.]